MPRPSFPSPTLTAAADSAQRLWPGFLTAALIAAAAQFVSDFSGGPALLFALLIGMAMHFAAEDARVRPGIDAASKTVLRIGVMLLGARIGVEEIAALGWAPLALVGAGVLATIGFGVLAARAIGLDRAQGVLTGGATAICGASAALAISAVLPKRPTQDRDTLFAVVAVTSLSTIAMIAYPALTQALGLSDQAAGVFLGGSIHDVAQVVGAGYIVSTEAGDAAVLTKLFRVALLAPIVVVIAIAFHAGAAAGRGRFTWRSLAPPWFLTGFLLFAAANSFGAIPEQVASPLIDASRWCLIIAIAAIGVKTALGELRAVGWRPLALTVAQTLFLATFVLAGVAAFGLS